MKQPLNYSYPATPKIPVRETLHGTELIDPFRWLEGNEEQGKEEKELLENWTKQQQALVRSYLDVLPQRDFLKKRFSELLRYDDRGVPVAVVEGDRLFYWEKGKKDEKRIRKTQENVKAEAKVVINPNQWKKTETLATFVPNRNGKYVAFGKAIAGDENPVVRVMEVESGEVFSDQLKGWKQYVTAWLPDHSGFYYSAKPAKGTVSEGDENYWQAVYLHRLGTSADQDEKVFAHPKVKEYWHSAYISEDGKYEIFYRSLFNKNEVFFRRTGSKEELTPIASGFKARYSVEIIEDKILITTDEDAPLSQVFITEVDRPERKHWKVFLPQHEKDRLRRVMPIGGRIYAIYQHNAHTLAKIYSLEGKFLRDLPLPGIGTVSLRGLWSKKEVWVGFSSFTYPRTTFQYHFESNQLEVFRKFPVEVEVDALVEKQVWYPSKDGTKISMFLLHKKGIQQDGAHPTLLYGYGGFNISISPYFSPFYLTWLEAGGVVAIPNLRGGGEYGREWHRAGMREKKQNVFDDFISAAEWLIENKYTTSDRLAISGASNGGLLVGATMVQRPELFKAVVCQVPLLDMIRYHRFGMANVWAEEYGSSEDPEQFKYLLAYSPYQNVKEKVEYPSVLLVGSERDARTDPLHARKMAAKVQTATSRNIQEAPIFYLEQKDSGHGGGTTLSTIIDQQVDIWAFLMDQLKVEN